MSKVNHLFKRVQFSKIQKSLISVLAKNGRIVITHQNFRADSVGTFEIRLFIFYESKTTISIDTKPELMQLTTLGPMQIIGFLSEFPGYIYI